STSRPTPPPVAAIKIAIPLERPEHRDGVTSPAQPIEPPPVEHPSVLRHEASGSVDVDLSHAEHLLRQAPPTGLEPAHFGLEVRRSFQLSYEGSFTLARWRGLCRRSFCGAGRGC